MNAERGEMWKDFFFICFSAVPRPFIFHIFDSNWNKFSVLSKGINLIPVHLFFTLSVFIHIAFSCIQILRSHIYLCCFIFLHCCCCCWWDTKKSISELNLKLTNKKKQNSHIKFLYKQSPEKCTVTFDYMCFERIKKKKANKKFLI